MSKLQRTVLYPRPKPPKPPGGWTVLKAFAAGGLCLILLVFLDATYHVFAQAQAARSGGCYSNIKHMVSALAIYANENDDTLPKGSIWMDSIAPYVPNYRTTEGLETSFHDPVGVGEKEYGYALNQLAPGRKTVDIDNPDRFILVFDSTLLGRNEFGDKSSMPKRGRHENRNVIGFLDSHVQWLPMSVD